MSLPTPNTRKEQFLNAIATGNSDGLPTPITREEEYLEAIAKSGGGSGDGDMKKSVYDSDLAVANAGGISAFVGNAVDEVKSESWSLGSGIPIANNTDLNNITTVGNYYATTLAAATLSHCPITGAFKLKVLYDVRESAPTYIEQVFNPISSYDEYRRYKSGSAEWSDWHLTNCNLDEVKGKVADNTGAIEAINENGCCNILPAYRGTYTENGVVFTANSDGTVTVDATQTGRTQGAFWFSELFSVKSTLTYNVSGCPSNGSVSTYCLGVDDANSSTKATDTGEGDSFTGQTSVKSWIYVHPNFVGTLTFKPMLYDARLNPTGYVPYAMTNRELTERIQVVTKTVTVVNGYAQSVCYFTPRGDKIPKVFIQAGPGYYIAQNSLSTCVIYINNTHTTFRIYISDEGTYDIDLMFLFVFD